MLCALSLEVQIQKWCSRTVGVQVKPIFQVLQVDNQSRKVLSSALVIVSVNSVESITSDRRRWQHTSSSERHGPRYRGQAEEEEGVIKAGARWKRARKPQRQANTDTLLSHPTQ
jgi:hypothetical protein